MRYSHFVTKAKQGEKVDHINGDTLDDRPENLRICTHKQNMRNMKVPEGRYKGISKVGSKWRAKIADEERRLHLGYFNTAEEAAFEYDKAAKAYFGEFARLNFPDN